MAPGAARSAFTRFAVVAFAPEGIVEDLRKLRAGCPPSTRPAMDCHVTVRRGFDPPADMSEVIAALGRAVAGLPAFSVRTVEAEVIWHGETADVLLPLEDCQPLLRLHQRIVDALAPLTTPSPPDYRPHVTVVERVAPDGVEKTLRAIAGWRVNYAWVVRDVDLVGLEDRKLWHRLDHFSFGRP